MAQSYQPAIRDEAVEQTTGKKWQAWFKIHDGWQAKEKGHKQTARYLQDEHGVPGWWAQSITVEYERARGLRAVGQRPDGGHEFSVQRTVPAGIDQAIGGWIDATLRSRWVPQDWQKALREALSGARRSQTAMGEVLRMKPELDQSEGPVGMEITFTPKGDDKTPVRVMLGRLSAQGREAWKAVWGKAMDDYRDVLRDVQ